MIWRWWRRLTLLMVLGLSAPVLLISASFYGYQRLTDEALLAELHFAELGPQQFLATVSWQGGCQRRDYLIFGDQWRVDALFIKWHYWASLLGLEPLYRLERIEGRYRNTEAQNRLPIRAYALAEPAALDLLQLVEQSGSANPFFDASYGSSAYVTIDPQRRYRLYRNQSGLLIRSTPVEAVAINDGGLTIAITRGCGDQQSVWQRGALNFNRWWLQFQPQAG